MIRPSLLRLIPMIIVSGGWALNVVLAYVRGTKILRKQDVHNKDDKR